MKDVVIPPERTKDSFVKADLREMLPANEPDLENFLRCDESEAQAAFDVAKDCFSRMEARPYPFKIAVLEAMKNILYAQLKDLKADMEKGQARTAVYIEQLENVLKTL